MRGRRKGEGRGGDRVGRLRGGAGVGEREGALFLLPWGGEGGGRGSGGGGERHLWWGFIWWWGFCFHDQQTSAIITGLSYYMEEFGLGGGMSSGNALLV